MRPQVAAVRRSPLYFAFAAAAIATVAAAITRSQAFGRNPDILAWGVTFDLVVTGPLIYWLIVVRAGAARPVTVAPVFAAGAAFAAVILPRPYHGFVHDLRLLAAPLEIVTLLLIARRIGAMGRPGADGATDRIGRAALALIGNTLAARVVASEVAVLWYAVAGWGKEPELPAGAEPVTVHRRSGWGAVVSALIVVIGAESVGLHLLIQSWSVRAAWLVTALDVYGVLWLLGDYNALRLLPSYVAGGTLHVRHGLRWRATVPLDGIESIAAAASETEWRRKGVLKLALADDPRFILTLRRPLRAEGLFGITRQVDAIALAPDHDAMISALRCDPSTAAPECAGRR